LSTDGFKPYIPAVEAGFGAGIEYSQLIKIYTSDEPNMDCVAKVADRFSMLMAMFVRFNAKQCTCHWDSHQ
jgi:hypothetical protein